MFFKCMTKAEFLYMSFGVFFETTKPLEVRFEKSVVMEPYPWTSNPSCNSNWVLKREIVEDC